MLTLLLPITSTVMLAVMAGLPGLEAAGLRYGGRREDGAGNDSNHQRYRLGFSLSKR